MVTVDRPRPRPTQGKSAGAEQIVGVVSNGGVKRTVVLTPNDEMSLRKTEASSTKTSVFISNFHLAQFHFFLHREDLTGRA